MFQHYLFFRPMEKYYQLVVAMMFYVKASKHWKHGGKVTNYLLLQQMSLNGQVFLVMDAAGFLFLVSDTNVLHVVTMICVQHVKRKDTNIH